MAQDVDYARTEFTRTQLAPNLYVLRGSPNTGSGHQDAAGGRVAVLADADGVLLVDTPYAALNDKLCAQIRAVS